MTYSEVARYARTTGAWSVAALGLAIPISTAADSIVLVLILIAAALNPRTSLPEIRRAIAQTPPVAAAALLFALLLIGCAHGSAPLKEAFGALGKYLDLMLIPVMMWAVFDEKTRERALICYGIAVVLNLYVAYSAAAGLPGLRHAHYPIGFKASVTHSIMVSLGAFLFLLWARETTSRGWRAALIALAALCAHNVLFIVIGRTGYVVLALLLAYYVMTLSRGWRGAALAVIVVVMLAGTAYFSSSSFQTRVDEIGSDLSQWRPEARDATSVGQRIEYYRTTLGIIADHPWIGVGTGAFTREFADKVRGTAAIATTNPHNDYLLVGAQLGIPGIALLLALYGISWHYASGLESRLHRDLARGLVITIAVGGLFNSLMYDHTEGLLFAWLIAVLYAKRNPRKVAAIAA